MTKHYTTSFYASAATTHVSVDSVSVSGGSAEARVGGSAYAAFGKRLFDICLAILLLPILVPVIAMIGFLVRRDGGAAMFGHVRVGKNGKEFKCWKIRTMVEGAEEKLASYLAANPDAAEEWARDHKLTNDPRITRFGQFLRKTSLDELPQIWNVLLGDMSFVGPRPIVQEELKKYGNAVGFYLRQKPGVTGLWQVSGRNDVTYDERVMFDIQYFRLSSFTYDLQLILRTVFSVAARTGR